MITSVQEAWQAAVTAAETHLEVTPVRVQQGSHCRLIPKLVQVILQKPFTLVVIIVRANNRF